MNRKEILIEADELLNKIADGNVLVFDASVSDGFYTQEHIPGAAFFDHERFYEMEGAGRYSLMPAAEKLAEQIGALGISNDTEVVVYACGMLPYAVRAWWVLRYAGHDKVRILNGGLSAWKQAGGPVEQEAHRYQPRSFRPQLRPWMYADRHEVLEVRQDPNIAIVNVMPLQSYEGCHIEGSSSLSCIDLMHELNTFLPDEHIAERLKQVSSHQRVITYCGGGIAAAVNAAAHLMTGYENVSVYHGSMYEWLAEGLPVVGNGKWEIWK